MIFGAPSLADELTAFSNLLQAQLAAARVLAANPAITAEAKAAANKAARTSAEAALAQISPAGYATANQAFIAFRNELAKAISAGLPAPPTAPAVLAPATSDFFTTNAKAIKIGGGLALAGVLGYVFWRRTIKGYHGRAF